MELKPDLKDIDMRPLLFELYESTGDKLRFYEEFCIGKSRADAILVSDELTGFEFKSDRDSLERLERQVKDYERFCDKNYIVVGSRLLDKAMTAIPPHWGIYHVYGDEEHILHIECIQSASANEKRMRLHNQMRILWRSELIPIMRKYKLGGVSNKSKLAMVRTMEHALPKETLRMEMTHALIERDYTVFHKS